MSSQEVRLLLVDDDPSAIHSMSGMLAQYEDQRFATSGEAALRIAREARPDLILLDVDMPGMTGFDVCAALKADPVLADVPVIFVTSHDTDELEVRALGEGGADFITKPLVAMQLTSRVRARLRGNLQFESLEHGRLAVGAPLPAPSLQAPRILIVDDDVAAIHVLKHVLEGMGEFHFAKSGAEALDLARSLEPQLILLDAHMPDLDGFTVCSTLKREPAFERVPIVFVTRFSDPENETRALDLGAADFVAKPYTAAVLQARVRNLLELGRRTEARHQAVQEHWRRIGDARVAAIVAGVAEAIVSHDAEGNVVLANAAACLMFGLDPAAVVGVPMRTLLGDTLGNVHAGAAPVRISHRRADGVTVVAEASASRIGEGPARLTTLMLRDVGDRERLEEAARARIEAEAASRTKTLMMAYIAHEMGNPLNGLLGFAQLMAEDQEHPMPAVQAQRLEHVVTSGRRLEALMRDVLDLGRFEVGKLAMVLVPTDLTRCVEAALAAVSEQGRLGGVTLSSSCSGLPILANVDADRIHQCLLNLLTNAIKYNRVGGWARVDVEVAAGEVRIAVVDNGQGMDGRQRQHLFEPFNRLGRQSEATPGAGMGLLITRQLVTAMHGRLRVESEPGSGSRFTMDFPYDGPPAAAPG